MLIPAILFLGVEGILSGETIGTIVGGMIGYLLSSIGDESKKQS